MSVQLAKEIEESISFFNEKPNALKKSLLTFIKPHGKLKDEVKEELVQFWSLLFSNLLRDHKYLFSVEYEIDPRDSLLEDNEKTIRHDVSKSYFLKVYKDKVYQLLEEGRQRGRDLSPDELRNLQLKIESYTMCFNEENIFSSCSSLIKAITPKDKISAKDYLKGKYKMDKKINDLIGIKVISSNDSNIKENDSKDLLTPLEKRFLDQFGHHTLEALLIHVMSTLFWSENSVKVATLVERIEKAVRENASILASLHGDTDVKNFQIAEKDVLRLPFGKALVEFLVERQMIKIVYKEKDEDSSSTKIIKKKKSFYLEKSVYAECLFNPAILPVQMNLPMIYPPKDWKCECPAGKSWYNISDLYDGGYLQEGPSYQIYDQYRLLSSLNENHFFIYFGKSQDVQSKEKASRLCSIMNTLQKQPFQINKFFLDELTSNVNFYVASGLLMPYYLNNLNINDDRLTTLIRNYYLNNEKVQDICSYNKILQVLSINIQQARYERTIFNLAKAYTGYQFYLPAFLDFRGRIYRCGILHFHERDLARSLIHIVDESKKSINDNEYDNIISAYRTWMKVYIFFHYQKFPSYNKAFDFFKSCLTETASELTKNQSKLTIDNIFTSFIEKFGLQAKNPFQFLSLLHGFFYSTLLSNKDAYYHINSYPITQDASASAYQIMSYFMLDETMGVRTNLIPSQDGLIQDIYDFFRMELLSFLKEELDEQVYTSIEKLFSRKLVKSIFMPLIYGKTLMSTNQDIKAELSQYMTHKECFNISRLCFQFWSTKYEHMDCLIRLIRIIGWFASTCDRPVQYQTDYFNTSQDYRVMEPYCIWVYDKLSKKRRKVTLRVSSERRDRKKTEVSTFVNFIHQKDAYIAMNVVAHMMSYLPGCPIYTVHDNFLTNANSSFNLPIIYLMTIKNMGPPLEIINEFLIHNLFLPVINNNKPSYDDKRAVKTRGVIPLKTIDSYLALNIPDNFKNDKRRLQVWEKNVSRLKTYYLMYVKNVTGGSSRWEDHQKKWEKFQNQLDGEYCIHL